MSGYVWYSYGSDVSGPALAEKLGFQAGKKTPDLENVEVLLCWGCKAERRKNYDPAVLRRRIASRELRVLNPPEKVKEARNKLRLLTTLKETGIVDVPGFIPVQDLPRNQVPSAVETAVQNGTLVFPIIGLNEYNKGKPIFCFSMNDVQRAAEQDEDCKVHYFRTLDLGEEYRIHVFRDQVLFAEKKELAEDPVKATTEHLQLQLKKKAEKEGTKPRATHQEIQAMVEELATDLLRGPSHMQRSTTHGWKLREKELKEIPNEAIASAVQALETSGLDVGAVHITVEDRIPRVTNIISAPGLSDSQLGRYADAIQEFAESSQPAASRKTEKKAEAAAPAGERDLASKEVVARITRRVRTGRISKAKAEEVLRQLEEE